MSLRRVTLLAGGLLVLVVIVLAVLALSFRGVQADAEAAKADLTSAKQALADGKLKSARELVTSARAHVSDAQEDVDGVGGDIWSVVPVAGGGVRDVRHLVSALDHATSIAEIGVDLYPIVSGKQATLFQDSQVDLTALDEVLAGIRSAGEHLELAKTSLSEVEGDTPLVGDSVSTARDAALTEVSPLHDGYQDLEPLLGSLPDALGASQRQRYLIAVLNPSELRYSGGATLAYAEMGLDAGRVDVGEAIDLSAYPLASQPIQWKKVRGNRFHRPGDSRLTNATFAPSWSVSGAELLRAWRKVTGEQLDGVVAVDVVALAQLLNVTGPLNIPQLGRLTTDNLVETLIGSYDLYDDPAAQDALNAAVVPAFQDRLFTSGSFVEKASVLADAADGRHFALHFRDPTLQEAFAAIGFTGDLADTDQDYLGVFTQNTNISKVDYWQKRTVSSDITLAADGSAQVQLNVEIDNATPPYAQPGADPRGLSYHTRWSGFALGVFLPIEAEVTEASLQGKPFTPYVGDFFGRPFLYRNLTLPPEAVGQLAATYTVPAAATVGEDGALTYRLTMDPQGMVNPEELDVTVHLPDGYVATSVPDGWTAEEDGTVRFSTDALTESPTWEILAEPAN